MGKEFTVSLEKREQMDKDLRFLQSNWVIGPRNLTRLQRGSNVATDSRKDKSRLSLPGPEQAPGSVLPAGQDQGLLGKILQPQEEPVK
jgi:hypothetical protein